MQSASDCLQCQKWLKEQGVTNLRLVSSLKASPFALVRVAYRVAPPSDCAPLASRGTVGPAGGLVSAHQFEVSIMSEKKRRGPEPMPISELRTVRVNVYLHPDEAAELDRRRGSAGLQRGPYMRLAALNKLPRHIPELNRSAWSELSRIGSNLNQLAREFNQGNSPLFDDVESALSELRAALIGANLTQEGDDDESESD